MIIAARFVVPVETPPIENGAVQFENGIITCVGKRGDVSRRSGEELIDYGDAVICPGFVNAHTHLELTDLAGQVPPTPDFSGWLKRLVGHFAEHPPTQESIAAAAREGVRQSLAAGVTTVGDITRFPNWTRSVLRDSEVRAVSFGEVIAVGKGRNSLSARLNAATDSEPSTLAKSEIGRGGGGLRGVGSGRLAIGVSPHSPYTVEPSAMRQCAAEANRLQLPICVHAAESREEIEFTRTGTGPLRDFLQSIDVWDDRIPIPGCSPIEQLDRVGLLTPRTLIAHANYVDDNDIALITRSGASVVYCPRTHAAFGHPPHRFMDMLKARINVCMGTDSLASNPSLSVLAETQFLGLTHPGLERDILLRMMTQAGASALGLGDRAGVIRFGRSADVAVIACSGGEFRRQWTAIFDATSIVIDAYASGDRIRVAQA